MNITPTPKMLEAMKAFVDGVIGEAPLDVEKTTAAENRRKRRRIAMDFLHNLVRLSMREGVGRYLREMGRATVEDQVKPDALAREVRQSTNLGSIASPHD